MFLLDVRDNCNGELQQVLPGLVSMLIHYLDVQHL